MDRMVARHGFFGVGNFMAIMQGTAAQEMQTSITQRKLKTCQMIMSKKLSGVFSAFIGTIVTVDGVGMLEEEERSSRQRYNMTWEATKVMAINVWVWGTGLAADASPHYLGGSKFILNAEGNTSAGQQG